MDINVIEKAAKAKEHYDSVVNKTTVSGHTLIVGVDSGGNCLIFRNSNVAMKSVEEEDSIHIYECVRANGATKVELLR